MELGNTIYCLFIFICSGFFINLMVFLGNIIQCPDVAEIGKNNFHLFFHSAYDCFFLCRRRKEKKYEHLKSLSMPVLFYLIKIIKKKNC